MVRRPTRAKAAKRESNKLRGPSRVARRRAGRKIGITLDHGNCGDLSLRQSGRDEQPLHDLVWLRISPRRELACRHEKARPHHFSSQDGMLEEPAVGLLKILLIEIKSDVDCRCKSKFLLGFGQCKKRFIPSHCLRSKYDWRLFWFSIKAGAWLFELIA